MTDTDNITGVDQARYRAQAAIKPVGPGTALVRRFIGLTYRSCGLVKEPKSYTGLRADRPSPPGLMVPIAKFRAANGELALDNRSGITHATVAIGTMSAQPRAVTDQYFCSPRAGQHITTERARPLVHHWRTPTAAEIYLNAESGWPWRRATMA